MNILAPLTAGLALALSSLSPVLAADAASLAELSWMQGSWRATQPDGAVVSETWLSADGGAMPGVGRTVTAGKARIEFMRIDERDGRLGFTAVLPGQPPTTFIANSLKAGEAVFENLAHDFPQRIIYRRQADGSLTASVEGTRNGLAGGIVYPYKRCQ